jgi:microcystin-dependent protein
MDAFVGEIRVFGFNFAPRGWALCNGQVLPISQNTALFSLLGTNYGGNGQTTFALPNLQARAAVHAGSMPGGSTYELGQEDGSDIVTLLDAEMPAHTHALRARATAGTLQAPAPTRVLARDGNGVLYQSNVSASLVSMAPQALAPAGGSLPHNNLPPILVLNFCIALQGIFPPRN